MTDLITLGGVKWPALSPNLSSPDYFLWELSQTKVYKDRSKTLENIQNNIRAEIGNISVDMFEKVTESFRSRLHQSIDDNGGRNST
ncbi:hypothetical protein TNCV_4696671 [Trichonephila clavipes]|nr:hypothetical protein TNCV_4696671 [Trichonephila clavipes]